MKFIDDIRRENLANLSDEVGGFAKLARLLNRSESQINQWVKGAKHSATGKKRGMKAETARWIEQIAGKPLGWLDVQHTDTADLLMRPRLSEAVRLAEGVSEDGLLAVIAILRSLTDTHPYTQKNDSCITHGVEAAS